MNALAQAAPTAAEVNIARGELLSQISKQMSQPEGLGNMWLDVDTFKLARKPNTIQSVTPGDVQRVAFRLFKNRPVATVVVGNSEELKSAFAGKVDTGAAVSDPAVQLKKP